MIVADHYSAPYNPDIKLYSSEFNEAGRKKYILYDGETYNGINDHSGTVNELTEALGEVDSFISIKSKDRALKLEFKKMYIGTEFDSDNQHFWETVYKMKIPSEN